MSNCMNIKCKHKSGCHSNYKYYCKVKGCECEKFKKRITYTELKKMNRNKKRRLINEASMFKM